MVHTGSEAFITNSSGHLTHRCAVHKWENEDGSDEYLRILSGGVVVIGGTASQEVYGTNAVQIQGTSGATSSLSLLRHGTVSYTHLTLPTKA